MNHDGGILLVFCLLAGLVVGVCATLCVLEHFKLI